jgi:hypothetical protein
MVTIPNGVDISVFKQKSIGEKKKHMGLDGKKIVLGVTGNGSQYKGLGIWEEMRGFLSEEYALILIGLRKEQIRKLLFEPLKMTTPRLWGYGYKGQDRPAMGT